MTEKQFEALKRWIRTMRDIDYLFSGVERNPGAGSLASLNAAIKALDIAEERARAELVED